jgi:hypothetical protein
MAASLHNVQLLPSSCGTACAKDEMVGPSYRTEHLLLSGVIMVILFLYLLGSLCVFAQTRSLIFFSFGKCLLNE